MKIILLIGLILSANLATTEALRCAPCSSACGCAPLHELNCKGGLVRDLCNCCAICAKIKGEKCGGLWHIYGKCDHGLTCYMTYKSYKGPIVIEHMGEFNAPGKCMPK